ncbi:MAG: putative Aminodeoxychorismate lyase [Solimicrobium sp.]|jgi:UPF0755 protein|nr:putative Aminodeoxychorismate lyase [Solimicrobium sp.]
MFKKLIGLFLLFLVAAAAGFGYWATQPISTSAFEFTIKSGSGLRGSMQQISNAGVPIQPVLFEVLARLARQQNKIKAGTYLADAGITPQGLLNKVVQGEFLQFSLTLIEGWTFKQMRQAIAQSPYLQHDTANLTEQEILAKLSTDYLKAEGLFFPDTYLLSKGSSDLDVYRQAFHQLQLHLAAAWKQRNRQATPFRTSYEALILASIVEKETGLNSDRKMIAGVFVNRLLKGMPLQTDPTVIYGMGEQYQGTLHKSNLLKDTPYNTYTRIGLPPTPIALVGRESITAALNPANTTALYFVSRGDGSSQFSGNLNDHNHAVRSYLNKRQIR